MRIIIQLNLLMNKSKTFMKGHIIVYSTKIHVYRNYRRQNNKNSDKKCNRDSRTQNQKNNNNINISHKGNILKVNLLFQINYGDAFEFV